MTDTPTRCAVYARYSSEKQNPLTVDQQIRKCREYADRHNMRILDSRVYADEAITGASDDRASLRALLSAARETPRPFDVILVDDTSRLSRLLEWCRGPGLHRSRHEILAPNCGMTFILAQCTSSPLRSQ